MRRRVSGWIRVFGGRDVSNARENYRSLSIVGRGQGSRRPSCCTVMPLHGDNNRHGSYYSYCRWPMRRFYSRGVATMPTVRTLATLLVRHNLLYFLFFQRLNAALAKPLPRRAGNLVTASFFRTNRPSRLTEARIWQ